MTALHVKHEHEDRDAPVNGTLDALETLIRVIIANGGEAALRARMARLLPAETPAAPASPSLPDIDPLDLAAAVSVCRGLEGFKLTSAKHDSLKRLREICTAWLATINAEARS